MEPLSLLLDALQDERPAAWGDLPDLSLYMDQVISYMPRQMIQSERSGDLTSAMVNNYIKDGLLPRTDGKRYSRIHLAYLTAICALKQVLSVREIKVLLQELQPDQAPEAFYNEFLEELNHAITETEQSIPRELSEEQLPHAILSFALRSYVNQLVCVRLLTPLFEKQGFSRDQQKKDKNKK